MVAPSTLFLLILTYLQVNVITSVYGLTLPLQTVTTKCESIIRRPQKPSQDCIVNEKLLCDSLPPDLTCSSPLLPLDASGRIANPVGNCQFINSQDGLYTGSVMPKDVSFLPSPCTEIPLNIANSMSLPDTAFVGNSKPCGLKLPLTVSSSVNSFPSANSKCLEDFVPMSPSSNQIPIPNSGPNPCNSNPYATSQICPLNNIGSSMTNLVGSGIPLCPSDQTPQKLDKIKNIVPNTCNYLPGVESSTLSPGKLCVNKMIPSFNNPLISPTNLMPSGVPQPSSCVSDISNIMNIPQSDMPCPFSILNQCNCGPTPLPLNLNNFATPFCNCQMQSSILTESPLVTPIQDSSICSLPSSNSLLDPNMLLPNENCEFPNISPLPVNQFSPINKYFKDVRAATAKLDNFISSFNSKYGSKRISQLQSITTPSQMTLCQTNSMPVEEPLEPSLCCARPVPVPTTFSQPTMIPPELVVTANQPIMPCIQSYADSYIPSAQPIVPVTFKAPIVPKTIISAFDFPINSAPIQYNNIQDSLASLLSSNCQPFNNLPNMIPSNPFPNFGCCNNLPDLPLIPTNLPTTSLLKPKSLASILNRPMLSNCLPDPNIHTNEDFPSLFSPELLSATFPKIPCTCDIPCKNPISFISSLSMNKSPDCEQEVETCEESSSINECSLNSLSSLLSSPIASLLSPESSLDESQLDLCCKNLEDMIALLESSMNSTNDVDCDCQCPFSKLSLM